jgi:hypothetical protein
MEASANKLAESLDKVNKPVEEAERAPENLTAGF